MITKYFNFLEYIKEALSVEQSETAAKQFIIGIYKNKEVAKKKMSIANRELKKQNITDQQWKDITKQISDIKSQIDRFIQIIEKQKKDYLTKLKADSNFSDETIDKYNSEITELQNEKKDKLENLFKDSIYLNVNNINDIINSEGKLTQEELEEVEKKALQDPFYLRLEELLNNSDYIYLIDYFIRLFYRDFNRFKIDLDSAHENSDYQEVRDLLGPFTYLPTDDEIIWNTDDNYGLFGSVLEHFKQLEDKLQNKLLDNFDKYKKMQDEELKKQKDFRVPGADMMSNDIRDMRIDYYTDSLLERLPVGIKDKKGNQIAPDLLSEYRELKDNDTLKKKVKNELRKLVQILMDNGVKFESKKEILKDVNGEEILDKSGKPVMVKLFPEVEKVFKMRKGTRDDPQEDKSLDGFIQRVKSRIQGLGNVGVEKLYDMIDEVNEKFGKENGAEVIFVNDKASSKPIIIFQVKSPSANWYLHNNSNRAMIQVKDPETGKLKTEWDSGKLTPTQHCIAWPIGSNRWTSYIKDKSYKLYYVYNFELDITDNYFPFGLIIDENGNISSAHRKDDTGISNEVINLLEYWGVNYEEVFQGLTEEERALKIKKKQAERKLLEGGISFEEFEECLQYVDPNLAGGRILLNSVIDPFTGEGSLKKVKLLAQKNANFNEPANILNVAIQEYFKHKNKERNLIVDELLKIRKENINGILTDLGNNPIPYLKIYLKTNKNTELEYILNKIKNNYDYYDGEGKLMGFVDSIEQILYLIINDCKINNLYFDKISKFLFPNNIVGDEFIKISKEILEKIPSKSSKTEFNVSVYDIFLKALIWSLKTNNFNYFKMVIDISKKRLDENEDDFIDVFIEETSKNGKSSLPEKFKVYLNQKLDEWDY